MTLRRAAWAAIFSVTLVVTTGRSAGLVAAPIRDTQGRAPAPVVRLTRNGPTVQAFSVPTLDGTRLAAVPAPGKVTLVNFWATWCGPCQAEIPDLVELQKKYAGQLQIVGPSEDDEHDIESVKAYVRARRVNYPVGMATPALHERFPEVLGLPTTFIIDREGRLAQTHVGLLDARIVEQEIRVLAGLPTSARVEWTEAPGR